MALVGHAEFNRHAPVNARIGAHIDDLWALPANPIPYMFRNRVKGKFLAP
jgi:hypothetical protein